MKWWDKSVVDLLVGWYGLASIPPVVFLDLVVGADDVIDNDRRTRRNVKLVQLCV